jgi:hypothetical protein
VSSHFGARRERRGSGEKVVRDTKLRGEQEIFFNSSIEGSQAVPSRISGRSIFERELHFRKRKGMKSQGKQYRIKLNNIYKLSSYLRRNTLRYDYKDKIFNVV